MMTDSGTLLHGVEANDKMHFDFTVRLPVIRDTIEALELTAGKKALRTGQQRTSSIAWPLLPLY